MLKNGVATDSVIHDIFSTNGICYGVNNTRQRLIQGLGNLDYLGAETSDDRTDDGLKVPSERQATERAVNMAMCTASACRCSPASHK